MKPSEHLLVALSSCSSVMWLTSCKESRSTHPISLFKPAPTRKKIPLYFSGNSSQYVVGVKDRQKKRLNSYNQQLSNKNAIAEAAPLACCSRNEPPNSNSSRSLSKSKDGGHPRRKLNRSTINPYRKFKVRSCLTNPCILFFNKRLAPGKNLTPGVPGLGKWLHPD